MRQDQARARFAALTSELHLPADVTPRLERRYIEVGDARRFALVWVARYLGSTLREVAIDNATGAVVRDRS